MRRDMQGLEKEIEEMKGEHIHVTDRMLPFGPTCTLNGVDVQTFVTCSKNGSITSCRDIPLGIVRSSNRNDDERAMVKAMVCTKVRL
jgi:hypothetical protein